MNRPGSAATALARAPTASARLPQTRTRRRPTLSASEPAVSSAPATPMLIELSSHVCAAGPAPSAEARVGMLVSGPQNVANARNVPSDATAIEVEAALVSGSARSGGRRQLQVCSPDQGITESLLNRRKQGFRVGYSTPGTRGAPRFEAVESISRPVRGPAGRRGGVTMGRMSLGIEVRLLGPASLLVDGRLVSVPGLASGWRWRPWRSPGGRR